MDMVLPRKVTVALEQLQDAGYDAYVVGGCVRDSLMGRQPHDWDIATSATPDQVIHVFAQYPVILTGVQHGTVTVLIEEQPLEITTFRIDGAYSDGRHPDTVAYANTVFNDLSRRDFTVNAIAFTPSEGMVDPYDGAKDIQARCIRCVGEASTRFMEDSLRILRAIRFSATLQFTIEPATANAVVQSRHLLARVSAERIREEITKLLLGDGASYVLQQYACVIRTVLPELSYDDAQWHAMCVSLSQTPPLLSVRLALMFAYLDQGERVAIDALRRLRFDNVTIRAVTQLLTHRHKPLATDTDLLRLVSVVDWDGAKEQLLLQRAIKGEDGAFTLSAFEYLYKQNVCCRLCDLAIDGKDLIVAGVSAGPIIGHLLQKALDAVIEGQVPNEKQSILKFLFP